MSELKASSRRSDASGIACWLHCNNLDEIVREIQRVQFFALLLGFFYGRNVLQRFGMVTFAVFGRLMIFLPLRDGRNRFNGSDRRCVSRNQDCE